MLVLISAQNLIALYLGLELMSLSLYVIAAFHRDNLRASEAGLKYFVLGALSSGMLLYGASLIYGFAGTVSFSGIAAAVQGKASIGIIFGLVFLMSGLAFKMSAVPFHMWTPDVYEGAPTPVTAFFASAVENGRRRDHRARGDDRVSRHPPQWRQIIVFISILSMALGAFAAIGQSNIKRLMAYSAIGHVGFAMVGLSAGGQAGVFGVIAYMAIYLVMTLGTFAAILSMRVAGHAVERISDLAGLARTDPLMAFFLAMMMFSLAGVPPLAGFFAKWYVFNAAIQAHLYRARCHRRPVERGGGLLLCSDRQDHVFRRSGARFDRPTPALRAVLAVTSFLVVFLFAYPGWFVDAAGAAAKSLF